MGVFRSITGASALPSILVIVALVAATLGPAQAAEARSPAKTVGVYRGAGNPGAIAAWESWLGRDSEAVTDYMARASWDELVDPWVTNQWSQAEHQVVYGLAMLPASGASLREAASGAYNDRFATIAQQLVDAGQPDAVIRLGLEFNGNWFPWSIGAENGPEHFAEAWRQTVSAMRAVPGSSFKFDWCPALGGSWFNGSQIDPARAYPGDEWVDYIGMDVYDQDWAPGWQNDKKRWRNLRNQPYGLDWHRRFADLHGKPMTYPEWGLAKRTDGHGGGDNPYFIRKMHRWIKHNPVAYHMYFEFDEADSAHELMGGGFPKAARKFRRLFGRR